MTLTIGAYVRKSGDSEDTVYLITGGSPDSWTIRSMDDNNAEETGVRDSALTPATLGDYYKTNGMMNAVTEVGANAAAYAVIQAIRKGPTFGRRFMHFAAADLVYELGLKHFMDRLVPFFQSPTVPIGYGVGVAELQDGVLKAIPIVLLQQIIGMLRGAKFGQNIMHNIVDGPLACTAANIAQRNLAKPVQSGLANKDKLSGKRKNYRF